MNERSPKTIAINEISRELKEREHEAMRLREAVGRIAALDGEIATLRASLKLLQGQVESNESISQSNLFNGSASESAALPAIVYKILKQAKKPLGASEVVALGQKDGKTINYRSLTSMMSQKISGGKLFYRDGSGKDGKYGLLEWKNEPSVN